MSESVTVGIVDVFPDAFQVKASEITEDHYVFDTTGGRHKVRNLRTVYKGRRIRFMAGNWPNQFGPDDMVTVTLNAEPE